MKILKKTRNRYLLFSALCLLSLVAFVFLAELLYFANSGMGSVSWADLLRSDANFRLLMLLVTFGFCAEAVLSISILRGAMAIKKHMKELLAYSSGLGTHHLQQFEQAIGCTATPGAVQGGGLGLSGDGAYGRLRLRYPVFVPWGKVAWVYPEGRSLWVYDTAGTRHRVGAQSAPGLEKAMQSVKKHAPAAAVPWSSELAGLARKDFPAFLTHLKQ